MRLPCLAMTLAALCATSTRAQQPTAPPAASARPDIEINASVRMDSIEFTGAPRAAVRFTGGPRLDTRHDVERGTLPRPVPAGRTYRDVTLHATISARLLDPAIEAGAAVLAAPAPASPTNEDSP